MRVVAGTARGQRLQAPSGRGVRPTSDRVKEAMFSSLGHAVTGARVLDLFAGSGSLAVEALSRGADAAVLVERDARAAQAARANLAATGTAAGATIVREDAQRFCRDPRGGPFSLVFVDPPYRQPLAGVFDMLADLAAAGVLTPGAVVVVERDKRDPALEQAPPAPLAFDRRRSYGDTVLLYLIVQGDA